VNVLTTVPGRVKPQIIYHYSLITDCGPPPVVVNAAVAVYSTTLLGSTATFTCDVGFGINGSGVISCLSSGWEAGPECVTGDDCLKARCFYNSFVCFRSFRFALFPITDHKIILVYGTKIIFYQYQKKRSQQMVHMLASTQRIVN